MKQVLIICFGIFLCLEPLIAQASDSGNSHSTKIGIVGKPKRPGMPSSQYIVITQLENELFFELPSGVEFVTVFLQNGEQTLSDMVTKESPSLCVEGLHGEYEITCRTDGNQVFGGFITLP